MFGGTLGIFVPPLLLRRLISTYQNVERLLQQDDLKLMVKFYYHPDKVSALRLQLNPFGIYQKSLVDFKQPNRIYVVLSFVWRMECILNWLHVLILKYSFLPSGVLLFISGVIPKRSQMKILNWHAVFTTNAMEVMSLEGACCNSERKERERQLRSFEWKPKPTCMFLTQFAKPYLYTYRFYLFI